jgi:hypothetical protein
VLLTSGVLAGGTRAYDCRADLRAVYQYYCNNHPGPDDTAYPVWQGLPPGAKMTRKDLEARVDACTGVSLPAAQRSEAQRRNLADILGVVKVPERFLVSHLVFATFTFQDLVQNRLGGRNPFTNDGVRYAGSHDDAALNQGVARFAADREAVRRLAYDSDLTGFIVVPTLTMHAKDDPTAFVEFEAAYRDVVARAGNADLLVQTFTNENVHSKLSTPQYAALFAALHGWIETGQKPSPASIDAACGSYAEKYAEPCRFDPDYTPPPLDVRSYRRRQ